jgi:SAM-dependent methyltransferase
MTSEASNWISFWDQPHSIYVNARHFDVHYRDVADGIVQLLPKTEARVLDFGCGEALHADRVAAQASELFLCESAPTVREHLRERFAHIGNIRVISPDDLATMPGGALDFIVANSVAQYLSSADLGRLLADWRRLLATDGTLLLGDVIPPGVSVLSDVTALLRYAAHNGFLMAALFGLFRTAFSPYRKVRAELGIATFSEQDIVAVLRTSGFSPRKLPYNLEHNPRRMAFLCTR